MPNKPFDYTIINPLERPTSSDINQLQEQAHSDMRVLARMLFSTGVSATNGFVGASFRAAGKLPPDNNMVLYGGVGFQQGTAESNIGGIAGVSDDYTYKVLYSDLKLIDVLGNAPPPPTGYMRRDLLQVRARQDTERLENQQFKGIYNIVNQSFQPQSKYKTLSSDLTNSAVEFIAYNGTPTAPVVYKTGQEVPLVEGLYDIDFSTAPIPDTDPGYMSVVVFSVADNTTAVTTDRLADVRPLLHLRSDVGGTNSSTLGDAGAVAYSNGSNVDYTAVGTSGQLLVSDGSNSPTWLAQGTTNQFLASVGPGYPPYWRSTLGVENGGTERNSLTAKALLVGNGTAPVNFLSPGTPGNTVISDGTNWVSGYLGNNCITRNLNSTFTTSSTVWVEITDFYVAQWENLRLDSTISIQPIGASNELTPGLPVFEIMPVFSIFATLTHPDVTAALKVVVTFPDGITKRVYVFPYFLGNYQSVVEYASSLPKFICPLPRYSAPPYYSVNVYAKVSDATATAQLENLQLVIT